MPHPKVSRWWLLVLTLGSPGCIFGGQTGEGVAPAGADLAGAGGWTSSVSGAGGWTSSVSGAGGWTSSRNGEGLAGTNGSQIAGAAGERSLDASSKGASGGLGSKPR